MAREDNLAYNLSRYENEEVYTSQKTVIKTKRISNQKSSFPKIVMYVLAAGLILCSVLYSKTELNMLYSQISKESKRLDILYSENVRMQSEYEGRTALKNVEEYAENVLGLHKLDKSQIEYVNLPVSSVVEISKSEMNIFVRIKNQFNRVIEYLRG